MSAIILPVALLVACMACAFGTARIIGWCIDQRDAARRREIVQQRILQKAHRETHAVRMKREREAFQDTRWGNRRG